MKPLRLFGKIAIVVVISLCATYAATMVISARMLEKIFIQSYTETNNQVLEQIVLNFEKVNEQNISIVNIFRSNAALKRYLTNPIGADEKDLFKIFYQIEQNIKGIEVVSNFPTYSIAVLGNNNRTYNAIGNEISITGESLSRHPLTQKARVEPFKIIYAYNSGQDFYGKTSHSIIAIKQLMAPYSSNVFGTLYIKIEEQFFRSLYEDFVSYDNEMMIIDKEGTILSSNIEELIGEKNATLLDYAKTIEEDGHEYLIVKEDRQKDIILAKYLPVYDMYLVNKVSMGSTLREFNAMKHTVFYICFCITAVAMICVFAITRKITAPLTQLIKQMQATKNGDFVKSNQLVGSYEARELQDVYNKMIDELNRYIHSLVKAQKQQRKAELEALQMQINPHFLYNTLATIKYLAWQGNTEKLTETINVLIDLLQNTIGKTDEVITLGEEIANLKNYVAINQARYGDRIQVSFYIEEGCNDYNVPKLILQPFLENAFFHAYQLKQEGHIRVFVEERKEYMLCEVADDGDGMKIEQGISNKQHFTGIGIKNVDERIKMVYGEGFGVDIKSEIGIGTIVRIKLPKSKKIT